MNASNNVAIDHVVYVELKRVSKETGINLKKLISLAVTEWISRHVGENTIVGQEVSHD